MALQVKHTHKLTYKLKLTPQMRLGLNLLQLPLLKLKEFVEQQIEENPLLEIDNAALPSKAKEKFQDYIDDEEKQNYRESLITKPPTLQEHLLRQLRLLTDSKDEHKIGELIIGNIDESGYLRSSTEEIAHSAKTKEAEVEKVLSLIQTFEPIGTGARDLRECLLIQLRAKANLSPEARRAKGEENSLAFQIVDTQLSFLEKKRFNYIAKNLKVSVEKVKEAMQEISNLEPKPGRSFHRERVTYLIPDAILRKNKDGYEVISNEWELPRVTLSDKYKKMFKQKDIPEETKEYLRERIKAARALIDAVKNRKQTIQNVIGAIIYIQRDFLDKGIENFKPMTLTQIANRVGKHKSTVSRAISNKYLQTPWGLMELRSFLNSGIKQEKGKLLSSKVIKSKIEEIIRKENKENPLSDQEIAVYLKKEKISISRRTIAKYRNQLKILASKSRR